LECEVALERKAKELEEILTIAAHELRHPTTVFKGYAYLLLEYENNLDPTAPQRVSARRRKK